MPAREKRRAVVLIDVISEFDFEDAELLLAHARSATERIRRLVERARRAEIPIVYVNDNYGRWQESFDKLVDRVLGGDSPGRPIAETLRPGASDLSVLKPKHSGFHATPLEYLLRDQEIEELILAGWQAHSCVLMSAYDAHMRGLQVSTPRDCVASNTREQTESALRVMEVALGADTRPGDEIELGGER